MTDAVYSNILDRISKSEDENVTTGEIGYIKTDLKEGQNFQKEFTRIQKQYEKSSNILSQDEILFGRMVEKKKTSFDSQSKPKDVLSKKEIEANKQLGNFYGKLGALFVSIASKRRQMNMKIDSIFNDNYNNLTQDQVTIDHLEREQEKVATAFNKYNKKIEAIYGNLEKVEMKTKNKGGVKGKQKLKKEEDVLNKELKEFENLQKFACFEDHYLAKQIGNLIEKQSFDNATTLREVVSSLKNFFEKGFYNISKLEKEMNAKLKVDGPIDDDVEIKLIPPKYLPISMKKMVGVDVEEVMKRPNETGQIPKAVDLMLKYVMQRLLKEEGVFRQSGKKDVVDILRRKLDNGILFDFKIVTNPHTVSSLLKDYFRNLPFEFCPFDNFKKFFKIKKNKTEDRIRFVSTELSKLDPAKQIILYRLFEVFEKVVENHKVNKMKPQNISICFATNILKIQMTANLKEMQEMTAQVQDLFIFWIENFRKIWKSKPGPFKFSKISIDINDAFVNKMRAEIVGQEIPKVSMGGSKSKVPSKGRNSGSFGTKKKRLSGSQPKTPMHGRSRTELPSGIGKGLKKIGGIKMPMGRGGSPMKRKSINKLTGKRPPAIPRSGGRKTIKKAPGIPGKRIISPGKKTPVSKGSTTAAGSIVDAKENTNCLLKLNDNTLISGDVKGNIKVWGVTNSGIQNAGIKLANGHSKKVIQLKAIDDSRFVSSSLDNSVRVWDMNQKKCVKILNLKSPVHYVMTHEKLSDVILVNDKKLISIDKESFEIKTSFEEHHKSKIINCFYSFGNIYTCSESDGVLIEWKLGNSKANNVYTVKKETINYSTGSSNKGTKVISSCSSGKYVTWTSFKAPQIIDTYKKQRIYHMFELNKKKDYYVFVFDHPKNDIISLAIGFCGLISSFPIQGKVKGIMKIGKLKESKFLLWDSNNKIRVYNQANSIKVFQCNSPINHVQTDLVDDKLGIFVALENGKIQKFEI